MPKESFSRRIGAKQFVLELDTMKSEVKNAVLIWKTPFYLFEESCTSTICTLLYYILIVLDELKLALSKLVS